MGSVSESHQKRPKLSTAILEGCKLVPGQLFGRFESEDRESACAVGTAWRYIEQLYPNDKDTEVEISRAWSRADHDATKDYVSINCPICHTGRDPYGTAIHLNDTHKMSREDIAAFLIQQGR